MSILNSMGAELEQEGVATRKVLERVPDGKFDWKPHEKSLPMGQLASHVADIPGWVSLTLDQDLLDLAASPPPFQGTTAAELVAHFDAQMAAAKASVAASSDDVLPKQWEMRMGEQQLLDMPKGDVLRTWVLNHVIHHRSQLAVYLRLNDIPVPAIYGASADESSM